MPCTYMCIIMVNGTTVIEFRFFNRNKKKKKENMDIVIGTQQTLAANLLFKNNSLCQTFRSLICDLLQVYLSSVAERPYPLLTTTDEQFTVEVEDRW